MIAQMVSVATHPSVLQICVVGNRWINMKLLQLALLFLPICTYAHHVNRPGILGVVRVDFSSPFSVFPPLALTNHRPSTGLRE